MNDMKKKRIINNKGVSLLELVVVIAIMATLTGLVVPQFMKYVNDKKQTACVEHREASVNLCEKIVVGRYATLNQLNGMKLNDDPADGIEARLPAAVPQEYKEALKRHSECPDHGTMSIRVINGTIQCVCSDPEHSSQDVAVDVTTWSGESIATIDPPLNVTSSSGYTPHDPDNDEEENNEENEPEEDTTQSYWPYPEDKRWTLMDSSSNAYIEVPVPSGLFPVRSAGGSNVYFCAIKRGSSNTMKVYKGSSADPALYTSGGGAAASGGTEDVIITNGIYYNYDSITKAVEDNPTIWITDNGEKGKIDRGDTFYLSGGTIYTCANGYRYIYFHQGWDTVELPPEDFQGNNYGSWYYVGPTDPVK